MNKKEILEILKSIESEIKKAHFQEVCKRLGDLKDNVNHKDHESEISNLISRINAFFKNKNDGTHDSASITIEENKLFNAIRHCIDEIRESCADSKNDSSSEKKQDAPITDSSLIEKSGNSLKPKTANQKPKSNQKLPKLIIVVVVFGALGVLLPQSQKESPQNLISENMVGSDSSKQDIKDSTKPSPLKKTIPIPPIVQEKKIVSTPDIIDENIKSKYISGTFYDRDAEGLQGVIVYCKNCLNREEGDTTNEDGSFELLLKYTFKPIDEESHQVQICYKYKNQNGCKRENHHDIESITFSDIKLKR